MGSDGAIGTGGVDAFTTVRPSGRGSGVVGSSGLESGVESISRKVVENAKGAHLHQDGGGAGAHGRRWVAPYGGRWALRIHAGEGGFAPVGAGDASGD